MSNSKEALSPEFQATWPAAFFTSMSGYLKFTSNLVCPKLNSHFLPRPNLFPVSFTSIYGTISHSVGPSHMPYLIYHQVLLAICKRIILNLITFSHLYYYCSYSASHDHSSPRLLLPRSPPCLTLLHPYLLLYWTEWSLWKVNPNNHFPSTKSCNTRPLANYHLDFISYHCLCFLSSTEFSHTGYFSKRS